MTDEAPPVVKAMHDLILAWVRQVEHVPEPQFRFTDSLESMKKANPTRLAFS